MTPKTINISYTAEDGTTHSREYTDLSQVWHPVTEEPQGDEWEVLCEADGCYLTTDPWTLAWKVGQSWEKYVRVNSVKRWLYISGLFPKGNVPSTT